MRPDYVALHHQYRVKATGQSKAEYAAAIERHRRPSGWGPRIAVAVLLILAAAAALKGLA